MGRAGGRGGGGGGKKERRAVNMNGLERYAILSKGTAVATSGKVEVGEGRRREEEGGGGRKR